MQLGSRWGVGAAPPSRLPDDLKAAIRDQEGRGATGSWTLTWLEGKPVVELDDGTFIRLVDGTPTVFPPN